MCTPTHITSHTYIHTYIHTTYTGDGGRRGTTADREARHARAQNLVLQDERDDEKRRLAASKQREMDALDVEVDGTNVGLYGTPLPPHVPESAPAVPEPAITNVGELVVGNFYCTNVEFTAIPSEKWVVRVDHMSSPPPPEANPRQHAVWSNKPIGLTWFCPNVKRSDTYTLHLSREDTHIAGSSALAQWTFVPVCVQCVGAASNDTIRVV